ncbi:hypothetical protein [Thermomonospora umbrina]|uniref:Uncharacterized protein n=1 Tax=Thermomonospora umbrina TaxID=111806 RepID=A0A3D9SW14_9ACTN|nr:hypothetical protein [Thermomonospora umbrina]REF00123.1 hypothetical protein DFJ69_5651 [Thermomonospora umbrina]
MGTMLTLTIPESTTTRFLIAADDGTAPGIQRLRDSLPAGGPARTARDLLASPLLVVTGSRAADSPWTSRADGLGGGTADLGALRSARHHLVVTSIATPAAQPRHAQAARLVARTLATATGGRVVDLAANQFVTDPTEPERDRFTLGDDWLGVFVGPDHGPTLRADTAGLHRFGLPELLARRVPYGRLLTAVSILRGLAHGILTDHRAWLATTPGAATWTLPATRTLQPADILAYWGVDRPLTGTPLPLRLTPSTSDCPECTTALELTPPTDQPHWWHTTAAPAVPASLEDPHAPSHT